MLDKRQQEMFDWFVGVATAALLLRKIVLDALFDYLRAVRVCRRRRRRRRLRSKCKREPVISSRVHGKLP